jgi:hypothetical protein
VLTVWAEGGAFWTAKNPVPFFVPNELAAAFAATALPTTGLDPRVGGEGAVGLDYNFAGTPWHLSFDMRYGAANAAGVTNNALSGSSGSIASTESLGDRESHGEADFMVGHEIGATNQLQLGLRVAYLSANLTNNIGFSSVSSGAVVASALASVDERSTFVGVGPRVAYEGYQPLASSWALEYMAGAAALVGERQLNVNDGVSCGVGTGTACLGSLGLATGMYTSQFSEVAPIFNADASLALAYSWGASHLSMGFRFDGYWDALRTATNTTGTGTGGTSSVNRLYYGPFVRVSTQF